MSIHYYRFTHRGAGSPQRAPLLERLLARADTSTVVTDWRADAFRLIAPQSANDEEELSSVVVAPGPSQQNIKTWGDLWRYDRKKFGWLILRYFFGTVVLTAMVSNPCSIFTENIYQTCGGN